MYLEIPPSAMSPHVIFKDGVLVIEGKSIPQQSAPFFEPLLKALNDYSLFPNQETRIELRVEYLNSDSMRSLMNIMIIAEKIYLAGHKVQVDWYYQDENDIIYDAGTIFQSLVEVPIYLKKKE